MDAISTLIFSSLAEGKGITLPKIGSLWIKPNPATGISRRRMIPPTRRVVFSVQESANLQNIVSLVASSAGISEAEALEVYMRWRDAHAGGPAIVIEGVGSIEKSGFKPSQLLEEALSPFGQEPIKVRRCSPQRKAKILLSTGLFLCVVVVGLWYAGDINIPGIPDSYSLRQKAKKPSGPALKQEAPIAVASDSIVTLAPVDNTAEDSIARALMAAEEERALLAANMSDLPNEAQAVIGSSSAAAAKANASVPEKTAAAPAPAAASTQKPAKEVIAPVQTQAQAQPALAPTPTAQPQAKPANPVATTNITAASFRAAAPASPAKKSAVPPKGNLVYHVVGGVYSVEANADKFIADSKKGSGKSLTFVKLSSPTGKVMVSIYQASSEGDAEAAKAKFGNDSLWIYRQRVR